MSWYDGIDLASLRTIRANSKYYTDPEAKKELEKKACELLQFAGVHDFFKDVNEPEDSEGEDDDEDDDDSGSESVDEEIDELVIADEYRQKKTAQADLVPSAPSSSGTADIGAGSDAPAA